MRRTESVDWGDLSRWPFDPCVSLLGLRDTIGLDGEHKDTLGNEDLSYTHLLSVRSEFLRRLYSCAYNMDHQHGYLSLDHTRSLGFGQFQRHQAAQGSFLSIPIPTVT